MKRLNFTLDEETIDLLNRLSETYFSGNKSHTVRAALESLAAHIGHDGWVITGYTPLRAPADLNCHSCGKEHQTGDLLYRPVFERGSSPDALQALPEEEWTECPTCVNRVA